MKREYAQDIAAPHCQPGFKSRSINRTRTNVSHAKRNERLYKSSTRAMAQVATKRPGSLGEGVILPRIRERRSVVDERERECHGARGNCETGWWYARVIVDKSDARG